ncbi:MULTISPECIES: DUF4390 domain-containing protein [unclassified Acidovorax]|uniref:DUF4390 domain-containing protein n=1 Tax=unclassified Acidovorax TaxID=2684926 RepID=UPI002882E4D9|nr:DUF4390 domain-containing protein [Acidovorax sp. WCS2018Cala2-16]
MCRPLVRWWLGLLMAAVLTWLAVPAPVRAQSAVPGAVADLQLDANPDGVFLSAYMEFELPALAEEALHKGISMYFVAEAEVVRERWYWYDKPVAHAVRHLRLSYQPLTRRWRLNQSAAPFSGTGLGVALGQTFEELADAISAMQRIARWKIAEPGTLEVGTPHVVHYQFRLDMSQLPRPFQIGAMGRSGWSLSMSRSAELTVAEPAR